MANNQESPIIAAVVVEGSDAYSPEEMAGLYISYLGSEVCTERLDAIASDIGNRYEKDGYLGTRVLVPRQTVRFGVVRITVIEGAAIAFEATGDDLPDSSPLRAYARKIIASRPLRKSVYERYALLMQEIPGWKVRVRLAAIDGRPGRYKLIAHVRKRDIAGFARIDNRGSKSVGRTRIRAGVAFRGLLSTSDNLSLRLASAEQSKELQYFRVGYDALADEKGDRWFVSLSYLGSEPGRRLSELDTDVSAWRGNLGVRFPLERSFKHSVSLHTIFNITDYKVDRLGERWRDDQLRIFQFGVDSHYHLSPSSRLYTRLFIRQGLNMLGSSSFTHPDSVGPDRDEDFTRLGGSLDYARTLSDQWGLILAARGQYSASDLPTSERFKFGGRHFGRAFDPAYLTGDSGLATKAEVARSLSELPAPLDKLRTYAYYDFGVAWKNADSPRGKQRSAAAAGLGLRWRHKNLAVYLEFGKPLKQEGSKASGSDPRFFTDIRVNF